ncbi:sensor histidine kinase [Aeromonas diversa CDC 2478-85]|uniref:histidine kinase n=1 Tax=Aeromonas diversa CDC 2478-85 TaxID=1268237 RepID=N9TXQ2_9GAMM|nr:HAMP domain-containing sensor histidine kinase [Aeromonas diversa]ENY70830.1 sensor histidine kinase [Aeromonas diversa CDC 2478-85]
MFKVGNKFQPRSLLTLVLTGYLLVLLPLILMIWHDYNTLTRISQRVEEGSVRMVQDTRRAIRLTALSEELERTLRRFAVLEDESLLGRYREQLTTYLALFDEHKAGVPAPEAYRELDADLAWLQQLEGLEQAREHADSPRFLELHRHHEALEEATNAWVDTMVNDAKARITRLQRELWWVSGVVGVLTLLAALLFTYLIIHPMRQLESRILSLGAGIEPERTPVEGPAELVLLGERLTWLHDKLQELEQQKYRFLRHVSHELKTPLACLREGADLLGEGVVGPLTGDQKEVCGLLSDNSRRLQSLIERLLDFNRLSQQESFTLSTLPLAPIMASLLDTYRLPLESKRMRVELPPLSLCVRGEPYRLGLILDNLFSNAVSYGRDGGTIWLRARQEGERVVIDVANQGTPIDEQERARIFEPFEQGSSRRHGLLKGSGIGLSIALESARSLGGELTIVEDEMADVCFRLTLDA